MKYVNAPVMKKDAMALVTGKPVYMDDLAPKDCLIVKVLRSPHAHALIEDIKTENALKQNGIECILTYKDVPKRRFTMAGQSFPEPSPYDRYILDQRVRFVGDAVAIVAGTDEAAIDRALKMIKVKYQVLEPVLDYHTEYDHFFPYSIYIVFLSNGFRFYRFSVDCMTDTVLVNLHKCSFFFLCSKG